MTMSDTPKRPADILPFEPPFQLEPGQKITEDVIARLFVQRYRGQFVYDHSRGAWFRFDGAIWRICETPVAFQALREIARATSASTHTETALQKVRFVKGAEEFSRADPVMSRTAMSWNNDAFLLGTPEGTVDLMTGRQRPSDAKDMVNRATAVAPAHTSACPLWMKFLKQATAGDVGLVRFLQQVCGYALTGDTREQALFFIHGPGGNGKGVFLNTISRIMGDYAATATMDVLVSTRSGGATTDLAMLNGARLVSASETEDGQPWAEARIKRMTGGDPITARFMRQDNITFYPVFKLVVIGNYQPSIRSVDEAMRRRFNIIPFTVKPDQRDLKLEEKLVAEWPAILRWMIEGCLDWQANGLLPPPSVANATEEYFRDQDTFGNWLELRCRVERGNPHLASSPTELFTSWKAFTHGIGEEAGTGKSFSSMLKRKGFRSKRIKYGMVYLGIELIRDENERV
jgi:putative DNA primase/helicase